MSSDLDLKVESGSITPPSKVRQSPQASMNTKE